MGRLNNHAIDNGDVEVYPLEYPFESTSNSVPYLDNTSIKSIYDDEIDQFVEFFHSDHYENLLDTDLFMLQAWPVVALYLKFYTVSTVLFNKYVRENVGVKNWISHFNMFFEIKSNVKLEN